MTVSAEGASGGVFLAIADGASASISALNEGRFRYDTGANQLQYSENNGPWTPFSALANWWSRSGTNVYPSTVTDTVSIGNASVLGGEQLRVVGDTSLQGDITFEPLGGSSYTISVGKQSGTFAENLYIRGSEGRDQSGTSWGYAGNVEIYAGKIGAYTDRIPPAGAAVVVQGGEGGSVTTATEAGAAGGVFISGGEGGDATGTGDGGYGGGVQIKGGTSPVPTGGGTTVVGGSVSVTGGSGLPGGDITLTGGTGSLTGNGGNVILNGGAAAGTGSLGNVYIGTASTGEVGIGTPSYPADVTITVRDNDTPFTVKEGTNEYIHLVTTNGSELLVLGNGTVPNLITALLGYQVSLGSGANPARVGIDIPDNDPSALNLNGGGQSYLDIDTSTGSEVMSFGNSTDDPEYHFVGTGTVELQGTGQKLSLVSEGYIGFGERTLDPSTAINEGALYTKDSGGVSHLFYRADNNGTVYQLTPPTGGTSDAVDSATTFTCPAGVAVREVVAITAANTVDKADADDVTKRPAYGIVVSKPTATSCTVRLLGELTGFTGLTPGATYYVSTTPGAITTPAPTGSGVLRQVVGDAISSTVLCVDIERGAALLAS